jgi:hypothetical protein
MESQEAILKEFSARKEQVLNLEMRLFLLILALEGLFWVVYVFGLDRVRQNRGFALGSASVYFVLFFELLAINGKMGLISMYLRQMEAHLATLGDVGAVWESKALDMIVFRPANAFTLPAGLVILLLLAQTVFIIHVQVVHFMSSPPARAIVTLVCTVLLILLVIKTITVDFHRNLPNVFEGGSQGSSSSESATGPQTGYSRQ